MGWACSAHENDQECVKIFLSLNVKARDHLEVLRWEGMEWINLALYRDLQRAVENVVINLQLQESF
jgi:hypothetical protein